MRAGPLVLHRTMLRAGPLLLLLALASPLASAHAVLQTAEPPPNGHVDEGITRVTVRFTESVERQYTDADVVDPQGVSWKEGAIEFDAAEGNVIHVTVRPLPSNLYSVSWKALSVDTHTTRGTFVFAVGSATLRPGEYAPVVDVASNEEVLRDGFARFAFYAGLFLAGGMPIFALAVVRAHPPRSLFATGAAFGAVGAAGAIVGILFLGERLGGGPADALATEPGRSFLYRGLLVGAAALACALAGARLNAWRAPAAAAGALGVAACVVTALGSHAAAVREDTAIYIAADAAHLVAALVWIGGIVAFLHALAGRSTVEVSQLVFRFGSLAVTSVILLLATGTLASVAHMPCFDDGAAACAAALRTERYMQLVALKLLLMAPLVALGAINKLTVGPRLAQGAWSPRTFRRIVQGEALLMAAIVAAAGVLAASSPPDAGPEVAGPVGSPVLELQNTTAKSHVILQVSPNPVALGVQRLVVIVHPLGPTLPNGTLVALKVWHEAEGEPELTIHPEKVTPNEWEIEDALYTSAGTWRTMVILQRPDEYVKIVFDVPVVAPGQTSS